MNKSELRLEWEQRIANFFSSGQSASWLWCPVPTKDKSRGLYAWRGQTF
jgi:hypothetical protein